MSTTTYFEIDLPSASSRDVVTELNNAISLLTRRVARMQLPAGTALRWGDIANGRYIEATSTGVRVYGGLDHGSAPGTGFRIPQGDTFPADPGLGAFFLRSDEKNVYYFDGTSWVLFSVHDADTIAALGAILESSLGSKKGTFPVSDGAGGRTSAIPGDDGTILVSDASSGNGWDAQTRAQFLGAFIGKGAIPVGLGGDVAGALSAGDDGTVVMADSSSEAGVRYATSAEVLGNILTAQGQLLGFQASPVAVPAAASNSRVLVSDTNSVGGVRWAQQSELADVSGVGDTSALDLFNFHNFF